MLEREVFHVAVDGQELPPRKDGKFDVEDTVFGRGVLHYEEEAEVPCVTSSEDGLHHLLSSFVVDASAGGCCESGAVFWRRA